MGRVTSKDVARMAGVSQTTVSFVLNDRTDRGISDQTRQHVLEAARKLGYVPSAAARSLRSGRSGIVLCLIPDFKVTQAMEQFKVDLSQALEDHGYSCVYLHYAGSRQPLDRIWQHIHPDVVVAFGELADTEADTIRRAGAAFINDVFGGDTPKLTGLDQREIGAIQVRYLADKGHQRIGFAAIIDPREQRFCAPRLHGARITCLQIGLPEPVVAVIDSHDDTAAQAARTWMDQDVTAVAAHNDVTALAVINAAHAAGILVPAQLAVIGVDDLPFAELVIPRLTTIALNLVAAAHELANNILELVGTHTHTTPPSADDIFQLIPRDSA